VTVICQLSGCYLRDINDMSVALILKDSGLIILDGTSIFIQEGISVFAHFLKILQEHQV